jgi:hypothetical protein
MPSTTCIQHAYNKVNAYCVRCGRPMCDLCSFWVGSALFCPECLSAGPSADERTAVTTKGVLSIGVSVLAVAVLAGAFMAIELMPQESAGVADRILTTGTLLVALGGIALGLVAREGAARTGSMLPLIGVIMNGAVLGVVGLLTVVAALQGTATSWP